MTQLEENLKEGIFENSEFKILIQLIDVLNIQLISSISTEDEKQNQNQTHTQTTLTSRNRATLSSSSTSSTRVIQVGEESSSATSSKLSSKLLKDYYENDDEDIVVVDGDSDLEKAESQDEFEDNYDDDDDVEYGQNRLNDSSLDNTLTNNQKLALNLKENEIEENSLEIQYLEKFKTWLNNCNSNRNLYFILYCLRILLRDVNYQKQFLSIENSFNSIAKLINKYVKSYCSLQNQILIHSHILDLLLNILQKLLLNETYFNTIESNRANSSSNTTTNSGCNSRASSGNITGSDNTIKLKKLCNKLFDTSLHVSLMHLVENSNDLCLVHSSLNVLIYISNHDFENRTKLSNDLDISDQILLILQEYDDDSKKLASKLLFVLLSEDKIKSEITNLDGIQVLLSLLHNHNNLDILWNTIWSLVQLCSYEDNKREIRLMGGIPLILSILCLDFQLESQQTSDSSMNFKTLTQSNVDIESSEKRHKFKLQIQAACCALITELAFNETNSYHIVNSNGVYLVASKLILISQTNNTAHLERNKEIERLHLNAWRTLRLLFSAERHRSLIKKLLPFSLFEQFVDIGNFKKDLKIYQPLVESFYKLNKEELESMKQQIQFCNQTQTPKHYINEYAVYEIIGSGAFGRVHKVKKKNSNNFLAMKEINTFNLSSLKDKSLGDIVNEVTIIRNNLKHPNIVRYLKTFKENDNLYIVMELIDGTPLSQHVRTLKEKHELWNEDKIWNYFIQIVLALKYLHKEKHIVHRDLTSNNIMLGENDKITITDFGLAKLKENDCSKMLSVVGTMYYSCPEIIKNEPYNEKADIWAIGCVLYEMCCLEPPFCTSNMLALATKITQADYDHDRLTRNLYSSLIGQVVQNCLQIDPLKRPDIVGVASLIAVKILKYTDSIRSKCMNLEKKLEKEKNKTQKMFCNKQDLNYINTQVKSSSSVTQAISEQNSQQPSPSQSKIVTQSSQKMNTSRSTSISIPTTSSQDKESIETNTNETNNLSKPTILQTQLSAQITSSPNAKLPPIRHPKSKLIMKNLQNKQQQQQLQQQQIEMNRLSQSNKTINLSTTSLNNEQVLNQIINSNESFKSEKVESNEGEKCLDKNQINSNQNDNRVLVTRSSSSSVLEKRSNQSKKPRPNSANSSSIAPSIAKKLRPIDDPIIQILDQIHKILFIAHLPPSGKKNFKRKLVDRYKRSLFSNKRSSMQIKYELMKLIKNSTELIDMEMIGLKSFQYCFNSSESNSMNQNQTTSSNTNLSNVNIQNQNEQLPMNYSTDLDMILNQNGITYEQLQSIIEELLVENNYHIEHSKHLREDLPSID